MNYDEYCCHLPDKLRRDIENDPKKWILSLPMFEYIHEIAYVTYIKYGGNVDLYNTFFNNTIAPLLDTYHKELHNYRFNLGILRNRYESEKDRYQARSELVRHMFNVLTETRRKVRYLYCEFVNDEILGNGPMPL